ncbi:dicarboxylate/amino acid:cation symporter [Methylobacterium brachythecii]|uniref:C4-dicarboxylate transport protein n=1 Tax=Methylobacterium brachythecii TaxID=1176177 RepID=A0A7W6ANF9_9HYPH|nr:dicarboxylate/amino acid:cation symporter [Methylobacterium brachythecii]MBB3904484.1 aerobic C4-dicarboxylate transport protein [Methylobacterium brachythecii]GLS45852.1 C4-dicarboxylate transport protein [Methylobacterium brachythecii]
MQAVAQAERKPFYRSLYAQVLAGILAGVVLGYVDPSLGVDMKPLGDVFIKMIKMVIGLVIFCTVVAGISGMSDMKKMGRLGGKALLYFEVLSTAALVIGVVVGNLVRPGAGMNADPSKLDAGAVAKYAGAAKEHGAVDFLTSIVPHTVFDALAKGEILPVVFIAVLFGFVLSKMGESGKPLRDLVDAGSRWVFGVINVVMRFAPFGAFGAMAYTIGKFGLGSLGQLLGLIGTFYLTGAIFVFGILGLVSLWGGFSLFKLLRYLKEELLITLGSSSSDAALPSLMEKLEHLGCSKSVVGLVVPTGYVFNADGTCIYMTLAALFVAQATNIDLTLTQQLALFGVSLLTSKGASGITGAGFIALVGTLSVVPAIPLAGMALILGIDRFMSEGRAIVNIIGNAVAAVVMAKLEGELDMARMRDVLDGRFVEDYPVGGEAETPTRAALAV